MYSYSIGDHCVLRLESTKEERYGKVVEVVAGGRTAGYGVVELHPRGCVRVSPDGTSFLGMFTLIKHVPASEMKITKKNEPYLTPHQQQIKDFLERRANGV